MNKQNSDIYIRLVTELKEMLKPLAEEFQFKLAVLFGSASRGWLREWSDIDIALISKMPIWEDTELFRKLREAFESIENYFKRDIDLVEITSYNIILLNRILKEGILLYEHQKGFYSFQRLHWRFLVEDNLKYTLNWDRILKNRLDTIWGASS